jgi:hypothetical protein
LPGSREIPGTRQNRSREEVCSWKNNCKLFSFIEIKNQMRKRLAEDAGLRKRFRAEVDRFGKKINYKGYSEKTILLKRIADVETDEIVADHLWFTFSLTFEKANVQEGSTLEFDARVKDYKKGYVNKKIGINQRKKDFKLSNPTKIIVIQQTRLPQ